MGLVFFAAAGPGCCSVLELPHSATEMELARSLSFSEGEIVMNGKSYLVEDGTIYRMIQGKRFRPRCRDPEMERILPRIALRELFRKGSVKAVKESLPILDRLGHALRWGELRDHSLHLAVHGDILASNRAKANASLSKLRAEWVREYLMRRWGIAHWRITAAAGLQQAGDNAEHDLNKDENGESCLEILAVGTKGQGVLQACGEGENGL